MVAEPRNMLCDSDPSGTNGKPHDRANGHGVKETVGRRFDSCPLHYRPRQGSVQAHRRVQPLKTRGFA